MRCHCQPTLVRARKLTLISTRSTYHSPPIRAGRDLLAPSTVAPTPPSILANALPQPTPPQAAVGRDQYGHVRGQGGLEQAQQLQNRINPTAGGHRGQDVPGKGNGTAAIQHTDDEGSELLTVEGCINGQSQLVPLLELEHPA